MTAFSFGRQSGNEKVYSICLQIILYVYSICLPLSLFALVSYFVLLIIVIQQVWNKTQCQCQIFLHTDAR